MKENKKENGMPKTNSDFKTRNRKKQKDKRKRQATEWKENEVEIKKDGKSTREEISRGSSLLHTTVRGQNLQRILGMWLVTVGRELQKERRG